MEIQFYHLLSTPLERALPKLMEKALAGGFRALVLVDSEQRAALLNDALWTYDARKFLPHGGVGDPYPEQQPIYITHREENPNKANLLVVTDGSALDADEFTRIIDIFDGSSEPAVQAARKRWQDYKGAGHKLAYIKQTPAGGWEKLAEAA